MFLTAKLLQHFPDKNVSPADFYPKPLSVKDSMSSSHKKLCIKAKYKNIIPQAIFDVQEAASMWSNIRSKAG